MSSNSSRDDVFLGGVRVLVVDDSGPVRGLMTEILEHYGATVTTVNSAYEALEILPHERPDVLVSDLEMPDKDGYWLIGQIRGLPPWRGGATPAAAPTGLTGPGERARILGEGFQYHIEKPVPPGQSAGQLRILARAQRP